MFQEIWAYSGQHECSPHCTHNNNTSNFGVLTSLSCPYSQMLNLMRSQLASKEAVRRMERLVLEQESREMLEAWTLLLWDVADDLAEAQDTILDLTARIKSKERVHKEDLLFFEDVQTQMEEEHKKELEKEREARRREGALLRRELNSLAEEVAAKEAELEAAMELKAELLQRIQGVFRAKEVLRQQKVPKEKESLLDELDKHKKRIAFLEKELKETKTILADESKKCFQEGVKVGRKLAAIEELAVLEELEMLKDIEKSLLASLERRDSDITLKSATFDS